MCKCFYGIPTNVQQVSNTRMRLDDGNGHIQTALAQLDGAVRRGSAVQVLAVRGQQVE